MSVKTIALSAVTIALSVDTIALSAVTIALSVDTIALSVDTIALSAVTIALSVDTIDLLQKPNIRPKINFRANSSSRFKPTNNNNFSPFKRTFAIREDLSPWRIKDFRKRFNNFLCYVFLRRRFV
ncbi:hypothetical protein LC653_09165 [Nostoc sp. CHAB 5784]|nr:hypothetical protein [Nostoc mirabile]MCC5664085.1 hypothetical protein [Nostoc mirabile CHAB5784]